MKKQYIFLIIISIILYISYLILSFTYKEYKINENIEYIKELNIQIKEKINISEKIIRYKSSLAYKNKILKEQQSFKNIGEKVVYLTTENIYNKFTTIETKNEEDIIKTNIEILKEKEKIIVDEMSIYEKWKNLIYKKNTYIE
ncbi:MAG: hypothetical protein Q8K30_04955 [Candidatus Gracilibacteria bacterium]|nr:hypothetical protein [Candidatus Gracilibacteria bacterium]